MELWIRTQNKMHLLNIESVNINNLDNSSIIGFSIGGQCEVLGEYKTKERTLQVLDEIQKKITEASFLWIENNGIEIMHERQVKFLQDAVKEGLPILNSKLQLKSTDIDTIVYEMPKE